MVYATITYRQREPNGVDKPRERCETVRNGPFSSQEAAENFAKAVASQTPVFRVRFETEDSNGNR
jgi:hypothetical protein